LLRVIICPGKRYWLTIDIEIDKFPPVQMFDYKTAIRKYERRTYIIKEKALTNQFTNRIVKNGCKRMLTALRFQDPLDPMTVITPLSFPSS
jgi:hypothetical protein